MQIQDINLGFKGRFQVTVKKEDGSIKTELPWQDNLITNEGIKLLNGINQVTNLNGVSNARYITTNCFVGSSSTEPAITDTKLGNYIAVNTRAENFRTFIEEPTVSRPNHVREYWQQKYIFTGLNNVNIAEVGLGYETDNSAKEYALFTHALTKDDKGSPSTITVLQGEILEINYEFSTYWDIRPKKGEFTLTKIKGSQTTTETYEYLAFLGSIYKEHSTSCIYIKRYNGSLVTYGVNTTVDTNLNAPYDFNKWNFPKVNANSEALTNEELKKYTAYSSAISGGSYPTDIASWSYQANYAGLESETVTNNSRDNTWCFSPYTFNHENGIRALKIPVGATGNMSAYRAYFTIVVAKKGSSHGLPKTEMDILKLSFRTTVNRYEGTP